jgi:nitrilase
MIRVASIQIAPIFLDTRKTWKKLASYIEEATTNGAELVTWGETLLPGYPVWISRSNGARFNDPIQKRIYAKYWDESIHLKNSPIIDEMKETAKKHRTMLMGGIVEKESGSTYCTLLTIGKEGTLLGRHRKIKPTYEERLVWADGDSQGIRTYPIDCTRIGGLNCWENWLPLARAALHLQEEMIHLAVWPGSHGLTKDITRFMALEGRSWVISTSGLIRHEDFNHLSLDEFPVKDELLSVKGSLQNGGSMIVDPTGKTVAGPLIDKEGILYCDIDPLLAVEERQNLDISGHYSRFDIFQKPM